MCTGESLASRKCRFRSACSRPDRRAPRKLGPFSLRIAPHPGTLMYFRLWCSFAVNIRVRDGEAPASFEMAPPDTAELLDQSAVSKCHGRIARRRYRRRLWQNCHDSAIVQGQHVPKHKCAASGSAHFAQRALPFVIIRIDRSEQRHCDGPLPIVKMRNAGALASRVILLLFPLIR